MRKQPINAAIKVLAGKSFKPSYWPEAIPVI
jgi:hypothetical protein